MAEGIPPLAEPPLPVTSVGRPCLQTLRPRLWRCVDTKVYHPDKLAGPKKGKKGGAAVAAPKRSASGATSPTKPSTPRAPSKKD